MNWSKAKIYQNEFWIAIVTKFGNIEIDKNSRSKKWKAYDNSEFWLAESGREKVSAKKIMLLYPGLLDSFPKKYKKDVVFEE